MLNCRYRAPKKGMLSLRGEMLCKAHTLRYTEEVVEVDIRMFLREIDIDDLNCD